MKKLLEIFGLNSLSILFDNDESKIITDAGQRILSNKDEMEKIKKQINKMTKQKSCAMCANWRRDNYKGIPMDYGFCNAIEVKAITSPENCIVEYYETDEDFYCSNFVHKK